MKRSSSSSKSKYYINQKPNKAQKRSEQDTISEKSINSIAANFEKSMISNFVTTQDELDAFKQNDEKDYEELDIEIEKWGICLQTVIKILYFIFSTKQY